MAIWDKPKQATVRVSDNLVVRSYGSSETEAVEELRRYAGDARLAEWERQSGEPLKVEAYSGQKRGVAMEYERQVEQPKAGTVDVRRQPADTWVAPEPKRAKEMETEGVSVQGEGVSVRRTEQGLHIHVAPNARNVTININLAELPQAGKGAGATQRGEFDKALEKAQQAANAYDRELGVTPAGAERAGPRPELRVVDGWASPKSPGTPDSGTSERPGAVGQAAPLATAEKAAAASQLGELRREVQADTNMRQTVVQSDRREDVAEERLSEVGGGRAHVEAPDRTIGKGVAMQVAGMAPVSAGSSSPEWRGTITEALQEVRDRHGDVAFASGDWQRQSRVRVYSARELSDTVERVRDLIEPEKSEVKAYTVKADGTIHNVVTNRDEFVALSGEAFQVRPELEARLEKEKTERAPVTRGAERSGPEMSVGSAPG